MRDVRFPCKVDLLSCDFVVDVELPEVMVNEELYFNRSSPLSKQFVSIWSKPYLHNPTSPFPYRSLYIPYLSTQRNSYGTYHVLANTARVPQVQRSPETDTEAAPSSQKKKKKRVTTPVESTVKPNPTE